MFPAPPATAVPAAVNVRAQVFGLLRGDATFISYLPDGANGVLPRGNVNPGEAATPFAWVRFGGTGSLGPLDLDRLVVAVELHDRPGYGFHKLDRAVDRLRWLVLNRRWIRPTASTEWPRVSQWLGASGELPDDGWNTLKRIARFAVYLS